MNPAVLSIVALLAYPLTEADVDTLIARGLAAKKITQAPGWIDLGIRWPKGSFLRTVALDVSEASYWMGIRTCVQSIPGQTFRLKMDGKAVDRAEAISGCVGVDKVRVFVYSMERENELVAPALGWRPWPNLPITAVQLELDGVLVPPRADNDSKALGEGFSALFDGEPIRRAGRVYVVATVNSTYHLRVYVQPTQVRALFEMPR